MRAWGFFLVMIPVAYAAQSWMVLLPPVLRPDLVALLIVIYAMYGPRPMSALCGAIAGLYLDALSVERDGVFFIGWGMFSLLLASIRDYIMIYDARVVFAVVCIALCAMKALWSLWVFFAYGSTAFQRFAEPWEALVSSSFTALIVVCVQGAARRHFRGLGLKEPRYRVIGN